MSVHPHLDAFWIYDFETYYNLNTTDNGARGYFASNVFSTVQEIFTTAHKVLTKSKKVRETEGPSTQNAHRSFFNSEMGFFKRWFS
jgi:hypothetical protein